MKKGDRISYQGQPGVIVEDTQVTPGMLDVKLDHERFVRRASPSQLARLNGSAHLNPRGLTKADLKAELDKEGVPYRSRELNTALGRKLARALGLNEEQADRFGRAAAKGRLTRADVEDVRDYQRRLASMARAPVQIPEQFSVPMVDPGPRVMGMREGFEESIVRGTKKPKKVKAVKEEELHQEDRIEKVYKEAEGYAEKVGFLLPSLETLENRYLGVLPNDEAYNKLESRVVEYRRSLKKRVEANTAAELAAGQFKPASGRIRGLLQRGEAKTRTAVDDSGAGVFTRPDPPRLARDGRTFCGNFIDGTAYYMAVSDVDKPDTQFVSWAEVYASAVNGGWLQGEPVDYVEPITANFTATFPERSRSAVLFGESPTLLPGEQKETGLFTRYELSMPRLFTVEDETYQTANYIPIIRDMVDVGLELPTPDGGYVRVAGVFVKRKGADRWAMLKAPETRRQKDPLIYRGDKVTILVPRLDFLVNLTEYFNGVYIPEQRRRGYEFFTSRSVLGPRGSGQAVRGKKGKRARRTSFDVEPVDRGGTRELAVRRRARGPSAESLVDTKKKSGGYQASPGVTFAEVQETGEVVFWRRKRSVPQGKNKHLSFLPYGGPAYRDRLRWRNNTQEQMPVEEALVRLSQRQIPAVSRDVAEMLVQSSLVLVTTGVDEEGEPLEYSKTLTAAPGDLVYPGDLIAVWDAKKASDPYFSWTRELVTDKLDSGDVGPCLTEAETLALELLIKFRTGVLSLRSQLMGVRSLFSSLREKGLPVKDTSKKGREKTRSYKRISRLISRLGRTLTQLADVKEEIEFGLEQPAGSTRYDAAVITLDAITAVSEETESPFTLFNMLEGSAEEASSLLTTLLNEAEELEIYYFDDEGYALNNAATQGEQRRLMMRLIKSFQKSNELGLAGVRFLLKKDTAPLSTNMVKAFQLTFGPDVEVPTQPKTHPLDDFFDWSLLVTAGMAGHEMTSGDKKFSARDVLTVWRKMSDLSALTGEEPLVALNRNKKARSDGRLFPFWFSENVRGFAIGGQQVARRRTGIPTVSTVQVDRGRDLKGAQEWLAARASLPLERRADTAPRLQKGPTTRVRRLALVTDERGQAAGFHRTTGQPVNIDLGLFEEDSLDRGLPGLSLEERLDRNDTYTFLLSDVFNSRVGATRAEDRKGEIFDDNPVGRDDRILELMLLAHLYYLLGGYELAGALGAQSFRGEETEIARGLDLLNGQIQAISGGAPLGGTRQERFTVWKTYNPVLFEMARLYWPTNLASEPRFKSILAHAPVLADVDAVGRYGRAAETLAAAINQSQNTSPDDLLRGYIGAPLRWLYVGFLNNDRPDVFIRATRRKDWAIDPPRYDEGFVEDVLTQSRYSDSQIQNALDVMDHFWPLGADLSQAYETVMGWLADPFGGLEEWKVEAARAFPKLLAHREAGLPRRGTDSLFSDEGARNAVKSGTPVESPQGDAQTLRLLRRALAKAVYMKHGKRVRIGEDNEHEWLADFIKAPPNIRIRKGSSIQSVRLDAMPRPTWWLGFVSYEPDVIKNLALIEASIEAPPGERVDREGVNNVPWLLRERTSPSRADGKTVFVGQPDIWGESVLAQVEEKAPVTRGLVDALDRLITKIEGIL